MRLAPLRLVLPPDLAMEWVSPAWSDEGVTMSFSHFDRGERPAIRQQLLQLRSRHADPAEAADDIVAQLLSTKPTDWVRVFGWNPA